LPASPCVGLEITQGEKRRERVYPSDELRAIFGAVAGTELENLVPLIAHAGTRSGETRSARWREFDFEQKLWTIPSEKAKNGESHPVPLSRGAIVVLARIRAMQEDASSDWLFPAPTREGFMDKPNKHVVLVRQRSGVADFRLHDVRRTAATGLASLGTLDPIVEAILGHAQPGLKATYNRYAPIPEMRAALEAWSAHLASILSGNRKRTVVTFARS
jgi:integrase